MWLIIYALLKIRNKVLSSELEKDFKKSSNTLLVELIIFLVFTLPTALSDAYMDILLDSQYGKLKLNLITCIQSIFDVTNIFVLIFNDSFRSAITERCGTYSMNS